MKKENKLLRFNISAPEEMHLKKIFFQHQGLKSKTNLFVSTKMK